MPRLVALHALDHLALPAVHRLLSLLDRDMRVAARRQAFFHPRFLAYKIGNLFALLHFNQVLGDSHKLELDVQHRGFAVGYGASDWILALRDDVLASFPYARLVERMGTPIQEEELPVVRS